MEKKKDVLTLIWYNSPPMIPLDREEIRVLLAGPPGAGTSSVARETAKDFQLESVELAGGMIRRAIAIHWEEELVIAELRTGRKLHEEDIKTLWDYFQTRYKVAFYSERPKAALEELLKEFIGVTCDTNTLKLLNAVQDRYGKKEVFWDQIPDVLAYREMQSPVDPQEFHGKVVDAKLSHYLEYLMSERFGPIPPWIKTISFLFIVDEIEAARRVVGREIHADYSEMKMEGIEQTELIAWLDEGKIPPQKTLQEMQAWYSNQVQRMRTKNQERIYGNDGDLKRWQSAYNFSINPFDVTQLDPEANIHVIDANQSKEKVLRQVYEVIAIETPKLASLAMEAITRLFPIVNH
jgi:hypothetical protein